MYLGKENSMHKQCSVTLLVPCGHKDGGTLGLYQCPEGWWLDQGCQCLATVWQNPGPAELLTVIFTMPCDRSLLSVWLYAGPLGGLGESG